MAPVKLLKKLIIALRKYKIPYMITGGQAVLLYREPRFTNDIDVTIGVDTDKLNLLYKVAEELRLRLLPDNPEEFVTECMVLPAIDDKSSFRIDFIFSNTEYEQEAIKRAKLVNIEGIDVSFCSLEDIIILKIFAGRQKDLDDAAAIIRKNKDFNRTLVEKCLSDLSNLIDIDLLSRLSSVEK